MSRFNIRGRLGKLFGGSKPAEPQSWRFDGSIPERWAGLREHYALGYQTMATAVVASWEVVAAELHRSLRKSHPEQAAEWTTRFSDSLVPTLAAFQGAERGATAVWKDGTRLAADRGVLDASVGPLQKQIRALGAEIEAAWPKTVDHLEPILTAVQADRARLLGVGRTLREVVERRGEPFAASLPEIVRNERFDDVMLDRIEQWRHSTAQDLEVALDQVRSVLVR